MVVFAKTLLLPALVFCLFVIVVLNLWDQGLSSVLNNSDLIQPYLVTEDLLFYPGTYYGWRHSAAPYVFPDWILAGLLVILPVPPVWKTVLYAAALSTGYVFTAGWIISQVSPRRITNAAMLFAILLIGVLFVSVRIYDLANPAVVLEEGMTHLGGALVLGTNNFGFLFLNLLAPFIHTGAILDYLLAVALMGLVWNRRAKGPALAALCFVVFLSVYSDALFVVWFVIPAAVVFTIRAALTRRLSPFLTASLLCATAVSAAILQGILHAMNSVSSFSVDAVSVSAVTFGQSVLRALENGNILMITLFIGLVFISAAGIRTVMSLRHGKDMCFAKALLILLAGTVVLGIATPVLSGNFTGLHAWRYLLVLPITVVLASSIFIARHMPKRLSVAAVPGLIMTLLVLSLAAPAYRVATAMEPQIELVTCLEAEGLTDGYAEYWMTKTVIFYSRRRVHIVQLAHSGGLYGTNYNRLWFEHRSDGTPFGPPNFVIMTGLERDKILPRFGEPEQSLRCGQHDIWLYDKIDVR